MIAAECRAAAMRVRLAARPAFCYSVIRSEAQRHEALLEGSSLLPAFEVRTAHDDTPVGQWKLDQLEILIRIMTPSSTSTHCAMINLRAPTKADLAEIVLQATSRQLWNARAQHAALNAVQAKIQDRIAVLLNVQAARMSKRAAEMGEQATEIGQEAVTLRQEAAALAESAIALGKQGKGHDRISSEPDLDPAASTDPPEYVVDREGEAAYACGFVSDALIAMAEHLDFRIRSPELVKPRGISGLDTNAKDVLKMLWTLKAFGEKSSKPLKAIAGRHMPTRNRRKAISTLEREAHKGFAELKERGLALARQNVGSWLTVEGRELAESTWGPKARK